MTEKWDKIQGKSPFSRVSRELDLTKFKLAGSTVLPTAMGVSLVSSLRSTLGSSVSDAPHSPDPSCSCCTMLPALIRDVS